MGKNAISACPCCGQQIASDRLLVDLNTNIAVYQNKEVEIRPPQVAVLVHALAQAWPKTVTHIDLGYAIWGLFEPELMLSSIRVHVSMARKIICRLGLVIEAIEGRGYRLVLPGQPLATAFARQEAG